MTICVYVFGRQRDFFVMKTRKNNFPSCIAIALEGNMTSYYEGKECPFNFRALLPLFYVHIFWILYIYIFVVFLLCQSFKEYI
jgi:hypothetical protein